MRVKIVALILLFTTTASANTFVFKERPFAFELKITKQEISYRSEARNFVRALNDCSFKIAATLNAENFLEAKTKKGSKTKLFIDGKTYSLTDQAIKYFRAMDIRILQFLGEERKKCST